MFAVVAKDLAAAEVHVARVPFVVERGNRVNAPVEKDPELRVLVPLGDGIARERFPGRLERVRRRNPRHHARKAARRDRQSRAGQRRGLEESSSRITSSHDTSSLPGSIGRWKGAPWARRPAASYVKLTLTSSRSAAATWKSAWGWRPMKPAMKLAGTWAMRMLKRFTSSLYPLRCPAILVSSSVTRP